MADYPVLFCVCLTVLGLMVGSFLNVVIVRVPARLKYDWRTQCNALLELDAATEPQPPNIAYPGSHCLHCKTPIHWYHNLPLVSFLWLKGRCAACKKSFSARYIFIEAFTGVLTLVVGLHFGFGWPLLAWLMLTWGLVALVFIDFEHQLLPDIITLPLLWLGLIYAVLPISETLPADAILGAALGYGTLWLVYQVHFLLTKREGMGYGDFKLTAVAGAWLGYQSLIGVVLLASLLGLLAALVFKLAAKQSWQSRIAFGPYLAAALLMMALYGETLTTAYFSALGL